MTQKYIVKIDWENNSEEFWSRLDTVIKVLQKLRKASTTPVELVVDEDIVKVLESLPYFNSEDYPSHASHPLLIEEVDA
jgi:hypothetical protein